MDKGGRNSCSWNFLKKRCKIGIFQAVLAVFCTGREAAVVNLAGFNQIIFTSQDRALHFAEAAVASVLACCVAGSATIACSGIRVEAAIHRMALGKSE